MNYILKIVKHNPLVIFIVFCSTLTSCAPKLTFTEIEEKINKKYIASNENDYKYEFNNIPVKYLNEYGEEGLIKKLQKTYEQKKDEYSPYFSDVGELRVQAKNKCTSTYFYKVKYTVDKAEMTPYLDSTALELNYKIYGKEHVNFNPNSKILETRLRKESIIIFDKDKMWKLLPFEAFDEKLYDRIFGKGFSKCLKSKVASSDYFQFW
ncbi:hypothetical protein [Yeosuana sp. AK3]